MSARGDMNMFNIIPAIYKWWYHEIYHISESIPRRAIISKTIAFIVSLFWMISAICGYIPLLKGENGKAFYVIMAASTFGLVYKLLLIELSSRFTPEPTSHILKEMKEDDERSSTKFIVIALICIWSILVWMIIISIFTGW